MCITAVNLFCAFFVLTYIFAFSLLAVENIVIRNNVQLQIGRKIFDTDQFPPTRIEMVTRIGAFVNISTKTCSTVYKSNPKDDYSCVSASMGGTSMSILLTEPTPGTQCTAQPVECQAPYTGPACDIGMCFYD